jgi:SAM-dependent methyltransferase
VRRILVWACLLCLLATAAPVVAQQGAGEEDSPQVRAFLEFRRWVNAQPEDVREGDVFAAYRGHLEEQGLSGEEMDQQLRWLQEGRERQEVEMWNRVLTSENPRFNTDPNEYLVRMVRERRSGRALDVGMGQGRNAIWLAGQGWDVTGFDPAEKAVALAHTLAEEAGVTIKTETVGSEDFGWGRERWDLVVLSYVSARPWIETIHGALKPGGLVMLEAFHDDSTKNASIGRGVVYETNELLELFEGFRILDYEDTVAVADFGGDEMPIVRLLAMKE